MDELHELDVGPEPGGEMAEPARAALLKAYDEDEIEAIMAMDRNFKHSKQENAKDEEDAEAAIASMMWHGS